MKKNAPTKIAESNILVESGHRLGEVEQKIVLFAIAKARHSCKTVEDLRDQEIIITASEYAEMFDITIEKAYMTLKNAALKIIKRQWIVRYLNERGKMFYEYHNFLQIAGYCDGEGAIKLVFSNAMLPMLLELSERFTTFDLNKVAPLQSQYAIRFYQFFEQFLGKRKDGWLYLSLEDLRFRFGLEDNEYQTMSNFKSRVLDYSINEINEKTDLIVEYEQKKQGRKIVGFRFTFKRKQKIKILNDKSKYKLSEKAANYFGLLLGNDSEFGSNAAKVGESAADFTARLQKELLKPEKVEKYWRWLVKAGYDPDYKKKTA